MSDQDVLRSIDSATEGIEALSGNVLEAIAADKSGWFGCRIKVHEGRVNTVQVSSDLEIPTASEPTRRKKRPKSN